MADTKTCGTCRWHARDKHSWSTKGTCNIIHSGGSSRTDEIQARIYPVQSGAYLETDVSFCCTLWEKRK